MIEGQKRQETEFVRNLYVGVFEAEVLCVNPDEEDFKELLGIELKNDSKATEYLGERDGNTTLRISVWLKDVRTKENFNLNFFLENKERENKDMTKKQYINSLGTCTWADDPNNLPDWFKEKDYRVAYSGEEELYNFLKTWLGGIDFRSEGAELKLDWKRLMKGNLKEISEQIGNDFCKNIVCLATVVTKERDGDIKEYQGVYNRAFAPQYALKQFRLVDYDNPENIERIKAKRPKDQKAHEKFALAVKGQYGCTDSFVLKDLRPYNAEDFLVASNNVISESGSDY